MKHLLLEEIEVIIEKELSFTVDNCVRGCHIFKLLWEAPVGSVLIAKHAVDTYHIFSNRSRFQIQAALKYKLQVR